MCLRPSVPHRAVWPTCWSTFLPNAGASAACQPAKLAVASPLVAVEVEADDVSASVLSCAAAKVVLIVWVEDPKSEGVAGSTAIPTPSATCEARKRHPVRTLPALLVKL